MLAPMDKPLSSVMDIPTYRVRFMVGWLILFIPLKIGMLSWFYFTDREFFGFIALKSLITIVVFLALQWRRFNQGLADLQSRETTQAVILLMIGRPKITDYFAFVLLGGALLGGMRAVVAPGIEAFYVGLGAADLLAIGLLLRWYVFHRWYWTEFLPPLFRHFVNPN